MYFQVVLTNSWYSSEHEVAWGGFVALLPTGNKALVPLIKVTGPLVKLRISREDNDPVVAGR